MQPSNVVHLVPQAFMIDTLQLATLMENWQFGKNLSCKLA